MPSISPRSIRVIRRGVLVTLGVLSIIAFGITADLIEYQGAILNIPILGASFLTALCVGRILWDEYHSIVSRIGVVWSEALWLSVAFCLWTLASVVQIANSPSGACKRASEDQTIYKGTLHTCRLQRTVFATSGIQLALFVALVICNFATQTNTRTRGRYPWDEFVWSWPVQRRVVYDEVRDGDIPDGLPSYSDATLDVEHADTLTRK